MSVVVPVYNSEDTIEDLVDGLEAVLEGHTSGFEILLVDDGSSDDSWEKLEKLSSSREYAHAVRLARNFGEHNAVLCGLHRTRHEVIVTLDDDLQQPPAEIPLLLDALSPEVDLVYGVAKVSQHGRARAAATAAAKLALEHGFGVPRATVVTSFRAFRSSVRDALPEAPGPMFSLDNLLWSATGRIAAVPVRHEPRRSGSSQYTLPKLYSHSVNMITGSSTSPLMFASVIGTLCVVCGLIGTIAAAAAALLGAREWPLTALLAGAATALLGVVLLALGIVGEYLARLALRASGRPAYVVDRSSDGRP